MLIKNYEKGTLEINFIYKLILSVDKHFVPTLSSEVDIFEYAYKLKQYANCILIEEQNKVIAFIFYYIIEPKERSLYITLICSLKRGIGRIIYNELVLMCAPETIELEVDIKNKRALSFYKNIGFEQEISNENKIRLKHHLK